VDGPCALGPWDRQRTVTASFNVGAMSWDRAVVQSHCVTRQPAARAFSASLNAFKLMLTTDKD